MAPRRGDRAGLALLAALLLAWFAVPLLTRSGGFPLGPDAPVYLWWTRIAGIEGLSVVGERQGVPAIALAIAGTLRLDAVGVLAGLEAVLATWIGVASAVLLRGAGHPRTAWFAGGAFAGAFASHLAAGYLANLAFVVAFLVAIVAVSVPGRRATVAAALLLGASGIAHPLFLGLGASVLLVAAWSSRRDDHAAARRMLLAVLGGGAVFAVSAMTALGGTAPLVADTSRDAFLRRAGLTELLRESYVQRFSARWTRYAPWAAVPAMVLGWRAATDPVATDGTHGTPRSLRRVLHAWVIVCGAGLAVALTTRSAPPDRFVMVAFAVPMLADPDRSRPRVRPSSRERSCSAPARPGPRSDRSSRRARHTRPTRWPPSSPPRRRVPSRWSGSPWTARHRASTSRGWAMSSACGHRRAASATSSWSPMYLRRRAIPRSRRSHA